MSTARPGTERTRLNLRSIVPVLGWAPTYNKAWLQPDVIAGVTLAAFMVPEAMAYASLAGLSPEHGLYAALIAQFVYAVFGTSRQLAMGATSALSIMVAGSLGAMSFKDSTEYASAAAVVAIVSGLLALLAWIVRAGFIANFVSETVLIGFSAGAALYIGSSQAAKLFGIHSVQGNFFRRVWNVIRHLGDTSLLTLLVAMCSIVALLLIEERIPRLPAALLVVIAAITISWIFSLDQHDVDVAGHIPGGLPVPAIPSVPSGSLLPLISLGFGVFLLSYIEGVGTAKSFAARDKIRLDANQELFANGITNLGSGLMQGFSVGGSMSSSAVKSSAGAKSLASGFFSALVIGLVLLFLTGPFSHLPEATLAAIVVVAVRGLIDVPAIKRIWELDKWEFLAAAGAFFGVLIFGMLEGIIIGVAMTFLSILRRYSAPQTSVLGQRPGSDDFVDIGRNPDAIVDPTTLVFRADSSWFYANAPGIRDHLDEALARRNPPPSLVIIDLASSPLLDLGTVRELNEIRSDLHDRGIELRLANVFGHAAALIAAASPDFGNIQADESILESIADYRRSLHGAEHAGDPSAPGTSHDAPSAEPLQAGAGNISADDSGQYRTSPDKDAND